MKGLMGSLLLFLLIHVHHTDAQQPFKARLFDTEPRVMVEVLNRFRSTSANLYNVTNMAPLTWDDKLAEKVKTFSSNCDYVKPGPGYRFIPVEFRGAGSQTVLSLLSKSIPDHIEPKFAETPNGIRTWWLGMKSHPTAFSNEIFYPPQTKIGCAKHTCKGIAPTYQPLGLPGGEYEITEFCVLGDFGEINPDLIKFKGETK